MKKYFLLILLTISLKTFAQSNFVNDSVTLLGGYRQDAFYSLDNGLAGTDSALNWDLAFATNVTEVSLLANHSNGITVYKTPYSAADFATLDTAGYKAWEILYNPYADWSNGAFNTAADTTSQLDYGWGEYNTGTHYVNGNRTFLIKIAQNSTTTFKKFYVKYKFFNWVFRLADIDNGSDITDTLDVTTYQTKNFVYFDIASNQIIDREPAADEWDLLFTHYTGDLGGGVHYPLTGALTNTGVKTVKATGVDVLSVNADSYDSTAYNSNISTIGSDWKTFNMSTYEYDMVDSTVYFVKTKIGHIYKVIFNSFDYMHGVISFGKSEFVALGVPEVGNNTALLGMYPNPATSRVNIITNLVADKVKLNVVNALGQVVRTEVLTNMNGLKSTFIDMKDMTPGIYFVTISNGHAVYSAGKLVKE